MRQFAASGFRLWNLGIESKVLYSAFCLLTFLGIASSALFYGDLVGPGTPGIRRYYAGIDDSEAVAPSITGPTVDLPPDVEGEHEPIVIAVGYRKLLEVTHFHLFTMPVILLIVGHLFFATGVRPRLKLYWVGAAAGSVASHLATPWLVRYGSASFALLHALTGLALTLTMSVLTLGPVVSMWRARPAERIEAR